MCPALLDLSQRWRRTARQSLWVAPCLAGLILWGAGDLTAADAKPDAKSPTGSSAKKPKKKPAKTPARRPGAEQGPTSEHPNRLLPLWSQGPCVAWRAEGQALYDKALPSIEALAAIEEPAALKSKIIEAGRAQVMLRQMQRLSDWLDDWGEPAGIDLRFRSVALQARLQPVSQTIRKEFETYFETNRPKFIARTKKAEVSIAPIRRLLDAHKDDEADRKAHKLFDELYDLGVWYTTEPLAGPMAPFEVLLTDTSIKMNPVRKKEAIEAIDELATQQAPPFAEVLDQTEQAAAAVGAGRKVRFGKAELPGPEAAARLATRWQELQLQSAHALAAAALKNPSSKTADTVSGSLGDFHKKMSAGLAKLIEADAAQIQPADVPKRYQAYQDALAAPLSLSSDPALAEPIASALEHMAARAPDFQSLVAAYRGATEDLLRWRARTAAAAASSARRGLVPANVEPFESTITTALPPLVEQLSGTLVKRLVLAKDFVGHGKSGRALGDFDPSGAFYSVPLEPRLQGAAKELRGALLAGQLPPLALPVAIALLQTERGDLAEVGGEIDALEIAPLIPLLAGADGESWGWMHLGKLPAMSLHADEPAPPARQIRLRAGIKPRWYRQAYTFVRAGPAGATASNEKSRSTN